MCKRSGRKGAFLAVLLAVVLLLSGSAGSSGGSSVPLYRVEGVRDGGAYRRPVTPVIVLGEGTKLKTLTPGGEPFPSGTAITASGEYTLEVAAEKGGEIAAGTIKFSLDIWYYPRLGRVCDVLGRGAELQL